MTNTAKTVRANVVPMTKLPPLTMIRNGFLINDHILTEDKKMGKFVPTHFCYLVKYGRSPVYVVVDINSNEAYRYEGSIASLERYWHEKKFTAASMEFKLVGIKGKLDSSEIVDHIQDQTKELPNKAYAPRETANTAEVRV